MEFDQVLALRSTTRAYMDKRVEEEKMEKILLAAQNAPLAWGDDKTTHLTVVTDPALMEEIRQACMLFSKKTGSYKDPFYGAQTLIFFSAADISDDHIEYCNAGCMIENMLLKAVDLGLGSTYIWGCLRKLRNHPEIIEKLKLPQGYEILSAMAVGYPETENTERKVTDRISVTWIQDYGERKKLSDKG